MLIGPIMRLVATLCGVTNLSISPIKDYEQPLKQRLPQSAVLVVVNN
jgi:hypothetical protein